MVIGRIPHSCSPQVYDRLQGKNIEIELNDYDSETNSFVPAGVN